MTEAWPRRWGFPPDADATIDKEWGTWNAPRDLRVLSRAVPAAPPEVLTQELPAFARVREALLRMRGNKPGSTIAGVQAMTLVDLFGFRKNGRLIASNEGWNVEEERR